MTYEELQALAAIRIILALGFFFVLAVLIMSNADGGPAVASRTMTHKVKPDEECKLHARKLSECIRLGYHDQPDDGSPDE